MGKTRHSTIRAFSALLAVALMAALLALAGCAGQQATSGSAGTASSANAASSSSSTETAQPATVRVASLKGPTSIGIASFIAQAKAGQTDNDYEFTVSGTADEVLPKLIQGDVDIALIPANAAATVYNRTGGAVSAIDVNTLGVLYVVSGDASIASIGDLAGRTVYMTGAGTTPEYVMRYLLDEAGLADDVTLEFKSEATEVAALLASDPDAVGVLPEPYVTSVTLQDGSLAPRVSLTAAWDELQAGDGASKSQLVTGVTVVRDEFADAHPEAVAEFLEHQAASVEAANADPAAVGELVVAAGIMDNATAAAQAIPRCNLVCLTGDDMREALSGYLSVLYAQDASSIGGDLPAGDFYFGA